MTATTHALVAGAIASAVPNQTIGLSLATISHPILDYIPHWDFGYDWRNKPKLKLFLESAADLGTGIILTYLLFGQTTNLLYLAGAVFLSEVWDMIEAPYWFLHWRFPPVSWVYQVQSRLQNKAKLPLGLISQVLVVLVVFVLLGKI